MGSKQNLYQAQYNPNKTKHCVKKDQETTNE